MGRQVGDIVTDGHIGRGKNNEFCRLKYGWLDQKTDVKLSCGKIVINAFKMSIGVSIPATLNS